MVRLYSFVNILSWPNVLIFVRIPYTLHYFYHWMLITWFDQRIKYNLKIYINQLKLIYISFECSETALFILQNRRGIFLFGRKGLSRRSCVWFAGVIFSQYWLWRHYHTCSVHYCCSCNFLLIRFLPGILTHKTLGTQSSQHSEFSLELSTLALQIN